MAIRWDYLLGDFYRFASLPVIFASIYFAVKDTAGVHNLVRGFVAVYGVMVALDLVRFNSYCLHRRGTPHYRNGPSGRNDRRRRHLPDALRSQTLGAPEAAS